MVLLFGTGAAITQAPVSVAAGETFFRAAAAMKPVDDTIRVGIDLGAATEDKKASVLAGSLKLRDIAETEVDVCKTETDCVPMRYTGPYFSRDSYGIGFDASGPQLKGSKFVGVKVIVDRPLERVVISWSNYSQ
jgi:hypothetical protein